MTTYRAYRLDRRRRIRDAEVIEAATDRAARVAAQELCNETTPAIEVWQAARLVDEIDCEDGRD